MGYWRCVTVRYQAEVVNVWGVGYKLRHVPRAELA